MIFLLAVLVSVGYVAFSVRVGRFFAVDEIVYKSAGLHLAVDGRFVSPELKDFGLPVHPRPDVVFGLQMPGYPLLFALWTVIAGFGWRQVFAFDALIHVALAWIAACVVRSRLLSGGKWLAWLVVPVILSIGTLGRADELTTALILSAIILLRPTNGSLSAALAGVLIAAACLTSPVGTLCTVGASLGWVFCSRESVARRQVIIAAASTVIAWVVGIGLMSVLTPGALEEFRSHGAAVHHLRPLIMNIRWVFHYALPMVLAPTAAFAATAMLLAGGMAIGRPYRAIVPGAFALAVFLLTTIFFHNQYYLLFSGVPLILILFVDAQDVWHCQTKAARLTVAACVVVMLGGVIGTCAFDWLRIGSMLAGGSSAGWESSGQKLSKMIPPGANVLADEVWPILATHAHVYDAYFSTARIMPDIDYVVLTGNGSGMAGRVKQLEPEIQKIIDHDFVAISDDLNQTPATLFGRHLSHSAYGMGTVVYRRRALGTTRP